MPKYLTHTDPSLVIEWTPGVEHLVTITGDRAKVLYRGGDVDEAKETYDYAVEHYEQRRIAGEIDAADGYRSNLEGEVPYVRKRGN